MPKERNGLVVGKPPSETPKLECHCRSGDRGRAGAGGGGAAAADAAHLLGSSLRSAGSAVPATVGASRVNIEQPCHAATMPASGAASRRDATPRAIGKEGWAGGAGHHSGRGAIGPSTGRRIGPASCCCCYCHCPRPSPRPAPQCDMHSIKGGDTARHLVRKGQCASRHQK